MPERDVLGPLPEGLEDWEPTDTGEVKPIEPRETDYGSSRSVEKAPRLVDWDRTVPRATLYGFLVLLLFVGAFGRLRGGWQSGASLHIAMETAATLLAFVVGALALVRFFSRRQATYLFIGAGFLGTGLLDAYHALLSSVFAGYWNPVQLENITSWSFTASGTFLSVSLFVSWLAWRQEQAKERGSETGGFPAISAAALLTVVLLVVFSVLPPTRAVYPEWTVRQPAELFPTAFFILALAGYLGKGHWRYDAFEHWVVVGLILGVMAHGGYMPFSERSFDADFDAAHLLKVLSYWAVLVGVIANVYLTFRREKEAAEATREANTALAQEIDVRRRAERVIQESEERLQDFLDNAHDLIQSVAPDGRFLYVNRSWKDTLGYTDEDVKDLRLFDILHPDCMEKCRRDFARILEGEDLADLEVDFLAADGRVVRCAGSANVRIQDGKPVATRSIFRDISEQVATQRELDASQANFQALVENTGDVIWSVDRSHRLITFNTAFALALEIRTGREPREGAGPEEVFLPADAEWYAERYARSVGGEGFSETKEVELGGQLRSYEFFFNPIREFGGITGVVVFGKDVTSRRRTQIALRMAKEEAERANKAKSQFLANMSHELRTPLNSVIGFTNILLKKRADDLPEQELGFLQRISANGRHLLELINQVLDLAKIEAGRMELEISPVNLDELVHDTVAQMESQVGGKDVTLRAEVPPDLDPVATDAGKLKQIVINLVGNALKFTEEGEVVVEVIPGFGQRRAHAIAVRDTGIGIPPERLQAIFEAFQQADGTTSRKYGGTGLGLTISRSLCQLLGYDLKVESEIGMGSTFTILLTDA
ncbi:PAS domain S-box protein, partial [Gemmatimonadota bacterium]